MITRDYLVEKIAQLTQQFEQGKAQLDALAGAKQAFQLALEDWDKAEVSKPKRGRRSKPIGLPAAEKEGA